jgi:NADH dehydrogenase [ubiquinone] 1 alpha subcomplex assembly factor 5
VSPLPPPRSAVDDVLRRALAEDLGTAGDLTTAAAVPADATVSGHIVARAAGTIGKADFLHKRAAAEVVDRLESVLKPFPELLAYGPGAPFLAEALTAKAEVGAVTLACESGAFLKGLGHEGVEAAANALPFAEGRFDAFASVMSWHAVSDLPGALLEAKRVLKPDGLLIAVFPGERSLQELRAALRTAETAITGGLSPRVMPMVAVRDGGALLQRAGFALPVADIVEVPVRYADPARLLADLRAMGETSVANAGSKTALRRDVTAAAIAALSGEEGTGTRVRVDLVALTGWKPHESQPKPLKPGSGKASLADAVKRFGG